MAKEELLEFDGTVTEVLPDGNFRVKLDNEHELLAYMLDKEDVAWLEEPIRHDDYAGYAQLKRELKTPIQIGENFSLPTAMETALAAEAAAYVMSPGAERSSRIWTTGSRCRRW